MHIDSCRHYCFEVATQRRYARKWYVLSNVMRTTTLTTLQQQQQQTDTDTELSQQQTQQQSVRSSAYGASPNNNYDVVPTKQNAYGESVLFSALE
jgi:hypothetical protein